VRPQGVRQGERPARRHALGVEGDVGPFLDIARPAAFCPVGRSGAAPLLGPFRRPAGFDGPVFGFGESLPDGTIDLGPAFAPAPGAPPANADPDALFSICWTSGTEGRPKAVPKTHNTWLCSARTPMGAGRLPRRSMKIAPAELDAALAAHPDVREAAVAAWPDPRLGERVCAFVVPRPERSVTLASLCAALESAGIARFTWPERLVLLDALPRNPLSKVERARLSRMLSALQADP